MGRRTSPSRGAVAGICLLLLAVACGPADTAGNRSVTGGGVTILDPPVSTFSIVARDPETGDLGVAVQSRFFGVGAVVPWARAGVGAVATQARANTTYGPRGLELLAAGRSAGETLGALIGDDEHSPERQLAIVDAIGRTASFTGDACLAWAGGRSGDGYAVQGNILAGPQVLDAMAAAFEAASGDLATRMLAALAGGEAAGGDARGRQSAALLVVREAGGYDGLDDRYIDLRVDDHPAPIRELGRLLDLRHGQIAARRAVGLLRDGDADAALDSAGRATVLSPDDGLAWMVLAAARLATGDAPGAAAAGRRALVVDPWLKTAAVRGTQELPGLQGLLEIEDFARLWEAIPVR